MEMILDFLSYWFSKEVSDFLPILALQIASVFFLFDISLCIFTYCTASTRVPLRQISPIVLFYLGLFFLGRKLMVRIGLDEKSMPTKSRYYEKRDGFWKDYSELFIIPSLLSVVLLIFLMLIFLTAPVIVPIVFFLRFIIGGMVSMNRKSEERRKAAMSLLSGEGDDSP